MSRVTLDLLAMDAHEHDRRILPDGSIRVDPSELPTLRTRLWLAANLPTESPNATGADWRKG